MQDISFIGSLNSFRVDILSQSHRKSLYTSLKLLFLGGVFKRYGFEIRIPKQFGVLVDFLFLFLLESMPWDCIFIFKLGR